MARGGSERALEVAKVTRLRYESDNASMIGTVDERLLDVGSPIEQHDRRQAEALGRRPRSPSVEAGP